MSAAFTSRASYLQCEGLQVARFASSDLLSSRKQEVFATPPLLRSLSQNCSEDADAPPRRCPWAHITRKQVLARESHGAFYLHGSSCLVKVNGLRKIRISDGSTSIFKPLTRTNAIKKNTTWTFRMAGCTFFVHILA